MDVLLNRAVTQSLVTEDIWLRLEESEPCVYKGEMFWAEETASAKVPELEKRERDGEC